MVFSGDHEKFVLPSSPKTSIQRPISRIVTGQVEGRLPCLLLKMEYLDSQSVQPMYPRKVARIVSSISDPTQSILQMCQVIKFVYTFTELL